MFSVMDQAVTVLKGEICHILCGCPVNVDGICGQLKQ